MKHQQRQLSPPGTVVGQKLDPSLPDDCVPMGDGRSIYSPSTRTVYNAEACVVNDLVVEELADG